MTKDKFRQLFEIALEQAALNAEEQLGRKIPRNFQIRLYGVGHSGEPLDTAIIVDQLYLGENLFYRIIDVAVIEVHKDLTIVFMRVSGHQPGLFEQTWNNPPGNGPFKQIIAEEIRFLEK